MYGTTKLNENIGAGSPIPRKSVRNVRLEMWSFSSIPPRTHGRYYTTTHLNRSQTLEIDTVSIASSEAQISNQPIQKLFLTPTLPDRHVMVANLRDLVSRRIETRLILPLECSSGVAKIGKERVPCSPKLDLEESSVVL